MTAALLASFAIPLNDDDIETLGKMASDLRFILGETEVHDRVLLLVIDRGYFNFCHDGR